MILCERGIKTFERSTRYTLDLSAIPVLKHETHLPVIVDPRTRPASATSCCRSRGRRSRPARTGSSSRCTRRPEEALCDGPQQIPTADFADFAHEIRALASLLGKTIG